MRWRATVICIFVLLLTCLSFGAVKEYGNDIKYPVQAAFSLVASNKDVDKGHVLDRIESLSRAGTYPNLSSLLRSYW